MKNTDNADLKMSADLSVPEFESFCQIVFERFWPSLVRFFERRYPTDAEDLAQQTLIKAMASFKLKQWQHLSLAEAVLVCGGYLWKTARTVSADHYRGLVAASQQFDVEEVEQHVKQIQNSGLTKDVFKQFLKSLSEEDLHILSRRMVDKTPFATITGEVNLERDKTGKPALKESAVRMRFQRAIEKLG